MTPAYSITEERRNDLRELSDEGEVWHFLHALADLRRAARGEGPQSGITLRASGGAVSNSVPMLPDPLGTGCGDLNEAQCRLVNVLRLLKKIRGYHWNTGVELVLVSQGSREAN